MRGGLGNATRPINMVDAHRFVKESTHADLVLNSPFCLIRTYKKIILKRKISLKILKLVQLLTL